MHGRLSQQRQHPGSGLSRAELEHGLHGADQVERVGNLCHRRPQHEGRLHRGLLLGHSRPSTNNYNLAYRFNNGIPNQITQNLHPYEADTRVRIERALRAGPVDAREDDACRARCGTTSAWSYYPAQQVGPTRFLPTAARLPGNEGRHRVQRHRSAGWASPTTCSGTGRPPSSSTRAGIWRRPSAATATTRRSCPSSRLTTSTTRTWTDANGNFQPGLQSDPAASAQDLRTSGGDFCGAWTDQNFGKPITTLVVRSEQILQGLVQPAERLDHRRDGSARAASARVDRRRATRGAGSRTSPSPTTVLVSPADYTPFSVTAPLDPRLPGGGGYVVDGLYNVVATKFSSVDNYRTYSPTEHLSGLQRRRPQRRRSDAGMACSFRSAPTSGSVSRTTARCERSCRSRTGSCVGRSLLDR